VIRRLALLAAVACVACTEVGTDPNAVIAVRFDGSAYPSIVAGDSLRDSLGNSQPLKATGLNYKGEPVADAPFVLSSPDTVLRVFANGNVFATRMKTDATPARVFATIGSLQSQPDSLYVVQRPDSLKTARSVDTLLFNPGGGSRSAEGALGLQVFGDTAVGKPKAPVQRWLVSFQLRYRGTLIAPTDTSYAFVGVSVNDTTRVLRFVDTTDASGNAASRRRVFVRSLAANLPEDTLVLISTIRQRKASTAPLSVETMIILRRNTTTP